MTRVTLPKVRVFVADDHDLVVDGLTLAIEASADLTLAGRASDGQGALAAIRTTRPDVAVLDENMPRRRGTEVLRALVAIGVRTRVLIISSIDTDALVQQVRAAGGAGVVRKTAPMPVFLDAVRAVARGETFFDPGAPSRVRVRVDAAEVAPRRDNPLTPREREVLLRVAAGASNAEVAAELGTSEGTVKNHVSNLLRKLDARDRTQAVLVALRDGWI